MDNVNDAPTRKSLDITSYAQYKKSSSDFDLIQTNDNAYNNLSGYNSGRRNWGEVTSDNYTLEEIHNIINSGSLEAKQRLSRTFYNADGYYKQILLYYATLLKFTGLLIPNPVNNNSLSNSKIQKRYAEALDFVDNMNLPPMLTNWALRSLIDGTYYGLILSNSNKGCVIVDLPAMYCRSNFKDASGQDIVEFNILYFDSITDETSRNKALSTYPKFIANAYRKYHSSTATDSKKEKWIIIPPEYGFCFPFFDGAPLFLSVIPKTIEYDKAMDQEQERDGEEIKKIIVQKIPHLTDGGLLFEPDEAAEIHAGTVGMLKGNKNVSILTTYADVDSIVSKTSDEGVEAKLKQFEKNIYSQAGVSAEIFSSTGSNTLSTSLKNDLALMMYLANKYAALLTRLIGEKFNSNKVEFKYIILPISYYNDSDYIDSSYKLSASGYSILLPALAQGLSQKDLCSIKALENDLLKLSEIMIPLSNSFTSGNTEGKIGRPALDDDQKSDKTLANEKSLDNAGGS